MENVGGEDWQVLLSLFPKDWQKQAGESGALTRLRGFCSAEALLRTILLHVARGYSLRETVTQARAAKLASVSDVALLKRLRNAEIWLRNLCLGMLRDNGVILPAETTARRVRVVDGTLVKEPGKTGSQWRLLYSMQLPTLICDFLDLTADTGAGTGEALARVPLQKDDLLLADAGYCSVAGIDYVRQQGADVVVRVNPANFPLYGPTGRKRSLLASLRQLSKPGNVGSGASEVVFPGIFITGYDVSPDGKQVVYSTGKGGKASQLWIASVDREAPPKRIGDAGETSPYFGLDGKILFSVSEGNVNYLERMNPDGSGRARVLNYPINQVQAISPGRRWVMAILSRKDGKGVEEVAIPTDGGPIRVTCASYCWTTWSPNGKFLYISVEEQSRGTPGRSLAIPVGLGETLPEFPPNGIEQGADSNVIPGAQTIERAELAPGNDPSHFAYVNTTVRRNLYRISLP
jgi:hypothetical protein